MTYILFLLIIIISFTRVAYGQTELQYNLDSVIVIANRVPVSYSEVGRSIEVISQKKVPNNSQTISSSINSCTIKECWVSSGI